MKNIITTLLIISCGYVSGQSTIDWSSAYQLSLSDFQSEQTEINDELTSYSIISGALIDFNFQMNAYAFMMTKNFNSKTKTIFNQKAAVITAPDSTIALQLVNFAQYNFDLTELYSRKFRKRMHEEKGTFSDFSFFRPIFDNLQEELNAETARVLKSSDLGSNEDILEKEHQEILAQIEELRDYCFDCKPPKRRKKNK